MMYMMFNNETAKKFGITGFNRNTNFDNGAMNSFAYVNVISDSTVVSNLQAYGLGVITSITIMNEDQVVYTISNIAAHITSMDESLNGTEISVSVNLSVNAEVPEIATE